MFEDSTFECTGSIRTRSRNWMVATTIFNGSILLALILIPLICPEALPRQIMPFLMEAPVPPIPQQAQPPQTVQTAPIQTEMPDGTITAPRTIPITIFTPRNREPESPVSIVGLDANSMIPGSAADIFHQQNGLPSVRQATKGPVRISSSVVSGWLLEKTLPIYPPMGKAMRVEGTVVLEATISKVGSIENLRVVSGPPILQQAALDAVRNWRYRPYQLNGEPVEVETTVNVIFTMGR